ncbi:MaoC like domain-containing protein [Fontibacillus panacisegetis]|uniref:MaoC like domain-containing protein n=1 Tax=Fontibacillus panacisegetis TaxID=670482 RepID=A0A1G7E6B3_9BACL|nr:MaoC family dehydratase [Fontibacillus panacisegetis]SDE59217.1 MaoC like domain-containing protein [Fontibacillus panacisegetis]
MRKCITAEAIQQYAEASKDRADIHLNAEAAAKAGFRRPIAHGMYIMGLAQSMYLSENPMKWITAYSMKFEKPLLVETVVIFDFKESNDNVLVTVTAETEEVIASGIFSTKERFE